VYFQLLVDNGQTSNGEDILDLYCHSNPDNLNAYKYLYAFLCQYTINEQKKLEQLKVR